MNHPRISAAWLVIIGAVCADVSADQVALNDGSILVGTVEQLADGKLTIVTEFAGKLVIDVAKVRSITSSGNVNVSLSTGDRLVGTITSSPDGTQSVVNSAVGQIPIQTDQVTALWPEGTPSPETVAAEKAIEAAKPKWTAVVEGGLLGTEGNSDTLNANLRASATRKTVDDLLTFYASADYSEQDDIRNKNQYIAGARYENSFPHKWENWGGPYFWYARTEFEYDEFEDLDLRATVAAGLGHYWVQQERVDFTTRVGAGYRHETYNDDTTKDDAILDLGYDFRYDLTEWARFTQTLVYSPSLEEFNEYRLNLDTALAFPLGKSDKWKFKTGVRKEYNSDPQPGFDDLDTTYYASIMVEFK